MTERVVRQVFVQRRFECERNAAHQNGVAIRRGVDGQCGSHRAARAGAVVDHHRLTPRFVELLSDDPRHEIGAAPRRERHDETDGLDRIRLRRSDAREPGTGETQAYR